MKSERFHAAFAIFFCIYILLLVLIRRHVRPPLSHLVGGCLQDQ
jgi:hypothetical protein